MTEPESAKQYTLKERVKKRIRYFVLKRASSKIWKEKHDVLLSKYPEFRRAPDPSILQKHRNLWKVFNNTFDNATFKVCCGISGVSDFRYVPEEIFRTDIEPTLNNNREAHFQANKSFYNRRYESGIFPKDLMHVIDGELLDSQLNPISYEQAKSLCQSFDYPVVVKPNRDSYGGKNVRFACNKTNLLAILKNSVNVVVQEKIKQHESMAKYHQNSMNTIRVYLYKSVTDNQIHILGMMPRFGNGGSLDNVSNGGMSSYIDDEGHLQGYAVGIMLDKFTKHPVSGESFTGTIPDVEKLKDLSIKIARKLFLLRIVGLDLCYDESGTWRVIEINTTGHTIRALQYQGVPFFERFTQEVIEYCLKNHWANK